jgi:hypothetical protein
MLTGSPFVSSGEGYDVNMIKTGSPYLSFDHSSSKLYSGSYPSVVKSVYQCGGKRQNRRQNKRQSRRLRRKQYKKNTRKNTTRYNKSGRKRNRSGKRR